MKASRTAIAVSEPLEAPTPAGFTQISAQEVLALSKRLRGTRRISLEGETRLFKSIPFLILFSLTVMNALLYVYLAANDFPAIDQKQADGVIRESFGKDYAFFSPVYQFLDETRNSDELGFPEFKRSLSKLNQSLLSFGISTRNIFSPKSFRFSGGGIYWSPPMSEGKTSFTPRTSDSLE